MALIHHAIKDGHFFFLFDVLHLLKNITNNLIEAYYIKGNNIISFCDIKKTDELDKQNHKNRFLIKTIVI